MNDSAGMVAVATEGKTTINGKYLTNGTTDITSGTLVLGGSAE